MTTMSHQWIAKIFYSDDTIKEVMNNNKVEDIDEDTDTSAIVIKKPTLENVETISYSDIYERAI